MAKIRDNTRSCICAPVRNIFEKNNKKKKNRWQNQSDFSEYKFANHAFSYLLEIQGVPKKMTPFEMQISPKIITRNQ